MMRSCLCASRSARSSDCGSRASSATSSTPIARRSCSAVAAASTCSCPHARVSLVHARIERRKGAVLRSSTTARPTARASTAPRLPTAAARSRCATAIASPSASTRCRWRSPTSRPTRRGPRARCRWRARMVRDVLERLGPGESQPSLQRARRAADRRRCCTLGRRRAAPYVLGAPRGNDLRLDDVDMWREHAALVRDDHGVTIRDSAGAHAVSVNGEPVVDGARLLHDGDTVSLRRHVAALRRSGRGLPAQAREAVATATTAVAAERPRALRRAGVRQLLLARRRRALALAGRGGLVYVLGGERSPSAASTLEAEAHARRRRGRRRCVCHPHPAFGGRMDTPLVLALADALRRGRPVDGALQLSRPRRLRAARRPAGSPSTKTSRAVAAWLRAQGAPRVGARRLLVRRAHGRARASPTAPTSAAFAAVGFPDDHRRRHARSRRRSSSAPSIAGLPGSSSQATPISSARSIALRAWLGAPPAARIDVLARPRPLLHRRRRPSTSARASPASLEASHATHALAAGSSGRARRACARRRSSQEGDRRDPHRRRQRARRRDHRAHLRRPGARRLDAHAASRPTPRCCGPASPATSRSTLC